MILMPSKLYDNILTALFEGSLNRLNYKYAYYLMVVRIAHTRVQTHQHAHSDTIDTRTYMTHATHTNAYTSMFTHNTRIERRSKKLCLISKHAQYQNKSYCMKLAQDTLKVTILILQSFASQPQIVGGLGNM